MALAVLDNVKKRVVSILNANPGIWSASVSGSVGAFPSDDEIAAACLEADEHLATKGYFQSVNGSLADAFETVSGSLDSGDDVPFHHGNLSRVELFRPSLAAWTDNVVKADSKDDVTGLAANTAYVGALADCDYIYAIEDGRIYHNADFARVTYPAYTRTSALQCNQNEETLIVALAVSFLIKHASPAMFEAWDAKAQAGMVQIIQDGMYSGGAE